MSAEHETVIFPEQALFIVDRDLLRAKENNQSNSTSRSRGSNGFRVSLPKGYQRVRPAISQQSCSDLKGSFAKPRTKWRFVEITSARQRTVIRRDRHAKVSSESNAPHHVQGNRGSTVNGLKAKCKLHEPHEEQGPNCEDVKPPRPVPSSSALLYGRFQGSMKAETSDLLHFCEIASIQGLPQLTLSRQPQNRFCLLPSRPHSSQVCVQPCQQRMATACHLRPGASQCYHSGVGCEIGRRSLHQRITDILTDDPAVYQSHNCGWDQQ